MEVESDLREWEFERIELEEEEVIGEGFLVWGNFFGLEAMCMIVESDNEDWI